jgi:uncharacterized delta-60 repeat protein
MASKKRNKAYFVMRRCLLTALTMIGLAGVALAQAGVVDPTFNVTVAKEGTTNQFAVRAVAVQPDGKTVIGGSFRVINGISRNGLARLNADGSVDATFDPGSGIDTFGAVNAIAFDSLGRILIAGAFSQYAGAPAGGVARLNADGTLDPTFTSRAGLTGQFFAVAAGADGRVVLGGDFSYFSFGRQRRCILVLGPDGNFDPTFDPGEGFTLTSPQPVVNSLAIDASGRIVVGGGFSVVNGVAQTGVVRFNANGSVDTTFVTGTGSGFSTVRSVAVDPAGRILAGGGFTDFNGFATVGIVRLLSTGAVDTTFAAVTGANGVATLARDGNGRILIGGGFTAVNGSPRSRIARLNDDGTLDTTFAPPGGPNNTVLAIGVDANSRPVVGGFFTQIDAGSRRGVGRLTAGGALDTTFNPGVGAATSAFVRAEMIDNFGRVVIAGDFTQVNGVPRSRMARINPDGTLDATFNPGTGPDRDVLAIVLDNAGRILIGGTFLQYNGTGRNRIARLRADGSLDTTFNPGTGANSTVQAVLVDGNDRVLIGGEFTTFNGTPRGRIARLDPTGALDTTFATGVGASGLVAAIATDASGRILIGGDFSQVDTVSRTGVARLLASGAIDPGFNAGDNVRNGVRAVLVDGAGRVVAGGQFGSGANFNLNNLVRLNPDGSNDSTFNTLGGPNSRVNRMAFDNQGRIVIGGLFTFVSGLFRSGLARIYPDGTVDSTFGLGTGVEGEVNDLAVDGFGRIVFGGQFTGVQTRGRGALARLLSEPDCTFSVAPTLITVPAVSGECTVTVTAPASCAWTSSALPFWMTVLSGSGTGNGTARFRIDQNPGDPRSASFRVADQLISIMQADGCVSAVSPTNLAVNANGGARQLTVSIGPGCSWNTFSPVSWVSVSPGGVGPGTVQLQFERNTGTVERRATLSIAGRDIPIVQNPNTVVTCGQFRPTNGFVFLRNANTSGFADSTFFYGQAGDQPLAGDWNGDGVDTIGIYRNGTFFLRNSNGSGFADLQFPFGAPGDIAIAGDWDGDGVDTVGIVRGNTVFLRNSNTAGDADIQFAYGTATDIFIAGDWNGDGVDTVGCFRPTNGFVYLRNLNTTGIADTEFFYGQAGDRPVAGDWNGDGVDTIGIVRGNQWFLRNSNTSGFADIQFAYGTDTDIPIVGNWIGR